MEILLLIVSVPLLTASHDDSLARETPFLRESEYVERLVDEIEEEEANGEILDWLLWLQDNPYDLNTATASELGGIPGVTPDEVQAILNVRDSLGEFNALDQLLVLEDGDAIIGKIRPYVRLPVREREYSGPIIEMRTRIGRDLQLRRGFRDGSFSGSPHTAYSRVFVNTPHGVQAGLVVEKDAGERLADGFASGHVLVKDKGIFSHVVVGDYLINAGQGLVLWRSSALRKGGGAVSAPRRTGPTVEPYRSAGEFGFLRGIAFASTLPFRDRAVSFTGFYSSRSLDASRDDSDAITTFYTSGLFRTESERRRRKVAREELLGGRLAYETRDWAVGGTAYHATFETPVVSSDPHEFSGKHAAAGGVDGWIHFRGISMFGEAAFSRGGGTAGIGGTLVNLGRGARLAIVYRSYSQNFHSLHANPFGERSGARNERGLYVGASVRVARWLKLSGYIDHFKFQWQTPATPLPAGGRDVLVETDVAVSRQMAISLRYTNKVREDLVASTDEFLRNTRMITDRIQDKARITTTYRVTEKLRFKWRGEITSVRYDGGNAPGRGMLVYQDIQYKPVQAASVEGRIVLFQTDSFDSRLYEFENDVRGVFSNPPLFDRGRRWYLLARFSPSPAISVSFKYAETQKEGVTSISSGLTEITGDIDNRVTVQFDLQL